MTAEKKVEIKSISIGVVILMLFSFGAWLNMVKADKTELEKVCNKQEKIDDILIDLRLDVKAIKTLLEKERR